MQLRHGFAAAYAVVVVLIALALRTVPEETRVLLLPVALLSECSVIGFFFAGAAVVLDRADGVLAALGTTPLRLGELLLARTAALSLLAVPVSLALAAGALGTGFDPLLLAGAAVVATAPSALLGSALACRLEGTERFLVWGGLLNAVLALPVAAHLGITAGVGWRLFPGDGMLRLFAASLEGGRGVGAWDLAWPLAWTAGCALLAHRWVGRWGLGRTGEA